MAFTDLPDDAPTRPLTGATFIADILDLVVSDADRRRGALAVLLCDEGDRLRVPVVIGELDDFASQDERDQALATIVSATGGKGSVLVAVARADGLSARDSDHAWAAAAMRACADGPRLLGVHVITFDGSREVPVRTGSVGGR